jgi:hypothetical protein
MASDHDSGHRLDWKNADMFALLTDAQFADF